MIEIEIEMKLGFALLFLALLCLALLGFDWLCLALLGFAWLCLTWLMVLMRRNNRLATPTQ
jgi:hypothetical protein